MMRALTVLPAVPVPAVTGLQLRMLETLQIVRRLGGHSSVLAFRTEDGDADIEQLRSLCDDAIVGGQRVPYDVFSIPQRVQQRLEFVWNAVRRRPGSNYPFSVRYDRMGAIEIVAQTIARTQPDYVILPSFLAHYAAVARRAGSGVIIDAPDVLTDLTRTFLCEYGRRAPVKIPGLLANHLAARSQERLFLSAVDEIWCTSEPEAARLASISGHRRIVVVPNAIPLSSTSPSPLVGEPVVGFIGTYSYAPNLDAARELVDEVLPLLRGSAPEVRVRLAGRGMPAELERRLRRTPNVDVVGPVVDASAFVASCRVMALPVRVRGGVPLKLVEAMAAQRPIVTTREMVGALPLRHRRELLVADSAQEAASAIDELLGDDALANLIAEAARRRFETELSLEAVIPRLAGSSVLATARPGLGGRREPG